jgi:hypothetical protein
LKDPKIQSIDIEIFGTENMTRAKAQRRQVQRKKKISFFAPLASWREKMGLKWFCQIFQTKAFETGGW